MQRLQSIDTEFKKMMGLFVFVILKMEYADVVE